MGVNQQVAGKYGAKGARENRRSRLTRGPGGCSWFVVLGSWLLAPGEGGRCLVLGVRVAGAGCTGDGRRGGVRKVTANARE